MEGLSALKWEWDYGLFWKMYGMTEKDPVFRRVWELIAEHSSRFFFAFYGLVGIYSLVWKRDRLLPYILIPFLLYCANRGLRAIIHRPRPGVVFDLPVKEKSSYSCPSNHAASSLIIAAACMYVLPGLGCFLTVMALLTGISRVFAGLHFPSDVLFGWLHAGIYAGLFLPAARITGLF